MTEQFPPMTRRCAFTLTEVLIAIGLIAVLAALAIPLISIVRGRMESAHCLNRLRVLGVAINLYTAEHHQKLPPLVAVRLSRAEKVPVIDNTLNQYVPDAQVFYCPADEKVAAESGTSYEWNSALSGQSLATLSVLALPDLSRIPVLQDKEGWHRYGKSRVNHLFADGHVAPELKLFTEE